MNSDDNRFRTRSASVASPRLSKSKLLAFAQCEKKLWLQAYRRDLAKFDPRTLQIFEIGHRVGELARSHFPNGVLLDTDPLKVDAAIMETKTLLEGAWNRPIFEAAFQRDDMIVRPDILQPDNWGGWRAIEVKSSTSVKPYMLFDVASQVWTMRAAGICISSAVIRHVDRRISSERQAHSARFLDVDVTREVAVALGHVPHRVAAARQILKGPQPERRMGVHCERPFKCEFRAFCRREAEK